MADEEEDKRLPGFRKPEPRGRRAIITGERFGMLTVDKSTVKKNQTYWECLCDCGNTKVLRASSLHSGHSMSCGCRKRIASSLPRTTEASDHRAPKIVSDGTDLSKAVAHRTSNARAKAAIHTDTLVGHLVEIAQASPADILPYHPVLQLAKANHVDHLIKKISIVPMRIGTRTRKNTDGSVTESPVIREKIDLEMYSRLDAIQQLRDNFGMKQEPRANSFEETKRQEIERGIQEIMAAESCDEPTAAQILLNNIGDAPHLVPVIQKYIKKHKKEAKETIQASGVN